MPDVTDIPKAGASALITFIRERGRGAESPRLGVARDRRVTTLRNTDCGRPWNDDAIAAALGELCAAPQRFPTDTQFRAAGLSGLYSALDERGELDVWAQRLGLARHHVGDPQRWDDQSIRHALHELCAGRDRFPTRREFRDAGLYGLYATLARRGALDTWAQQLQLPRRSHPTYRRAARG